MNALALKVGGGALAVLLLAALEARALFSVYDHGKAVNDAGWQTRWADRDAVDKQARALTEVAEREKEQALNDQSRRRQQLIKAGAGVYLGRSAEEQGPTALQSDEVELLLLGIIGIPYPLIPPFAGHIGTAFWPELFEELAGVNRLNPCIDRFGSLSLRPKGRPSPMDCIYVRAVLLTVQHLHVRRRSDV